MINEKFVAILRNKKDEIINLWLDDFKKTRTLRILEGIDEGKWRRIMGEVMDGFDEVLTKDISKYRICLDFTQFGREVFKDNYAMHDIINSMSLLKKVIIDVVTTEGFFGTAFQLYQQVLGDQVARYAAARSIVGVFNARTPESVHLEKAHLTSLPKFSARN